MSSLFRPRMALCALFVCVLSACGGGGDDNNATAQAALRPSSLTVEAGNSNITAGVIAVDTSYSGASGTGTIGGETVEWLDISIPGSTLKGQLVYSTANTSRYAIMLVNEANPEQVHACRGPVAWSGEQLAYLLDGTNTLEDLPTCGGSANMDRRTNRHFEARNLVLPDLSARSTPLTLTTAFHWALQVNDINFEPLPKGAEETDAETAATPTE